MIVIALKIVMNCCHSNLTWHDLNGVLQFFIKLQTGFMVNFLNRSPYVSDTKEC